jgi:hypothetical protein
VLTAVLKAVKMLLSCCPKNSQDAAVLAALKQSRCCCPSYSKSSPRC